MTKKVPSSNCNFENILLHVCVPMNFSLALDCRMYFFLSSPRRRLHFVTTVEVKGKSYVGEADSKRDSKVGGWVGRAKAGLPGMTEKLHLRRRWGGGGLVGS